jgi:hypothetical protein
MVEQYEKLMKISSEKMYSVIWSLILVRVITIFGFGFGLQSQNPMTQYPAATLVMHLTLISFPVMLMVLMWLLAVIGDEFTELVMFLNTPKAKRLSIKLFGDPEVFCNYFVARKELMQFVFLGYPMNVSKMPHD